MLVRMVLGMMLLAIPAAAQVATPCTERSRMIEALERKYSETVAATGIGVTSKHVFEITTSPNGTWTILATDLLGRICMIAAGHSWEMLEKTLKIKADQQFPARR